MRTFYIILDNKGESVKFTEVKADAEYAVEAGLFDDAAPYTIIEAYAPSVQMEFAFLSRVKS